MERIRTFLAVDLASPVRERIASLQRELARGGSAVKWTEPENLHFTLVFLGEVDNRDLAAVHGIASEALAGFGPFLASVEGVGCFPHPRRPRVVWVGAGQGAQELVALRDALEEPLTALGYRREERRYVPHVTLGRVKGEGGSEGLAQALARHAAWKGGEMEVSEVRVMGSELTRDGPLYTVLGRVQLR